MSRIHPQAYVDPSAELADDVIVGPHCYVGAKVVLGEGCVLRNNATVAGGAICGRHNIFFAGSVVGEDPQDLKYRGGETRLVIGDDNIFRECVTVNRGTEVAGGVTKIGSHNRFMAYVHVAHDAVVGNHCILSNTVQLAGHVKLEDHVTMGGLIGVHHFTTLGKMSYVGGLTRIVADVPPYMIVEGNPGQVRGFNEVGMRRWGMDDAGVKAVREAYRMLFGGKARDHGSSLAERLAVLDKREDLNGEVRYLCDSIRRSLHEGIYGRQLEKMRRDTDADRRSYYGEVASDGNEQR